MIFESKIARELTVQSNFPSRTAACLQRKPGLRAGDQPQINYVPGIVHEVLRSPGRPLDQPTRKAMESRFGHDFGRVRIHTDACAAESAQAVDASAYTVGSHVAFAEHAFAPETAAGRRLLAHELTHFLQQAESLPSAPGGIEIAAASDELEREADAMGQPVGRVDLPHRPIASQITKPVLSRSPDESEAGKSPAAGGSAKAARAWSPDELGIWLHSYNVGCNSQIVWGAFVQGTGPIEGDGPPGYRTCPGRLVAYEGESENFYIRYWLEGHGPGPPEKPRYPHSLEPLEGISEISARFEYKTAHGQQKVLLDGKDSAPTFVQTGGVLSGKFGGGVWMRADALVVPIIFPDSGLLRVVLQMHYVGPPATDVIFDDLIDVELVRSGPGTETGIYLHVPDPKTPLVYKRVTGYEGWQKKGVIVTVWSDDRGYYYNSKAGKIRLPEKP